MMPVIMRLPFGKADRVGSIGCVSELARKFFISEFCIIDCWLLASLSCAFA
jgi:hypothetical protein